MAQRNVLTVFLASPGDLKPEREESHQVVVRLNKSVAAPLSWQIDLLGWEDTTPGYARPQEKINSDVDRCDLFIGLIWQRWGQPTGTHTSGFIEEFERALARRRKTQAPEIWLFFKKVPEDRLTDPGEQLRQVLTFRKLQEEQRELLYQEFGDLGDWSQKLYDWLARHTIQLSQESPVSDTENSTPFQSEATPTLTSPAPDSENKESAEAALQITRTMAAFSSAIHKNQHSTLFQEDADFFSISRLNLFSASLLSNIYSHDILGTHDINLLYQNRDILHPFQQERLLLLRTVIGNSETTAPGWYWFRHNKKDYLLFLIAALAQGDSNSEVMKRSIKLLSATKTLPDKRFFDRAFFIRKILEGAPQEASGYLSAGGSTSDFSILMAIGSTEATEARICILARSKPEAAFEYILDNRFPPPQLALEELQIKSSALTFQSLTRALHSPSSSIRVLAFKELERRGAMTRAQATESLEDTAAVIRQIALE